MRAHMYAAVAALLACTCRKAAAASTLRRTQDPEDCRLQYPPGIHKIEIQTGGETRHFLAVVPSGPPAVGELRPAIVDWHGYSEGPYYQNELVGLREACQRYSWVGALPYGTAPTPTQTCCPVGCDEQCCEAGLELDSLNACSHNAGGCCGAAASRRINDVDFARLIVDWMEINLCADRQNVFGTGFSNGGMMANRAACDAAGVFKGVAPVSGNLRMGGDFPNCDASRPVSWLSVCGAADSVCNSDFARTAQQWAEINRCTGEALPTFTSATTQCNAWQTCADGTFVEYCQIDNLGHEWSGRPRPDGSSSPQPATNLDATTYIFQRFSSLLNKSHTPRGK